ncbi:MAG: membrane dipeptidase, partial [Cyclobacteriaceae bacterium]|nr:membrane dipeptidase [Cyclobacteriaceae bacterium]
MNDSDYNYEGVILDAHLDLAMNAVEWNRDLQWSLEDIRKSEEGMNDKPDRGKNTVCFPELRKGNIGIVVATQIARYVKPSSKLPGWNSPEQAWAMTQAQRIWYKTMEENGQLKHLKSGDEVKAHLADWLKDPLHTPIGYVLSLEGADSMVDITYVERAWKQGLRLIGPAHYGPGTYAFGTDSSGSIGKRGEDLLKEMDRLHMILDSTHLCDKSFWEALDVFNGPVWSSHTNSRTLVNHNRQYSDEQYLALIERGAVLGVALDTWMMVPNWVRGTSTPLESGANLSVLADHIDHICQLAGNANHVGIGSDLDGAFGIEQSPSDLNSIADLKKLPAILHNRG